ncbi:MAG: DUF11 domain-containing protein [Acidobacteria bacterium]|nr:DUF11 domain-containing protein [Acidobacteriota bacterium]
MDNRRAGRVNAGRCAGFLFFLLVLTGLGHGAVPAGYSEFYIPGDEGDLMYFHNDINGTSFTETHTVISVVAWAPDTVVYYDHWENGYDFDPENPEELVGGVHTYDEKVTLANRGDIHVFESTNIPVPRNPANVFYDGRDRMCVVGGMVSVQRLTWPSAAGTVEALEMGVFPVRPQLTTYIIPFGEDLVSTMPDFERVFALVQATADNTVVRFDLNGDGVLGDTVYRSRTDLTEVTEINLNKGDCYLLCRPTIVPTVSTLNHGTKIQGNETLQVHYFFMDEPTNYESRGVSAFPTGLWTDEYYAPVDSAAAAPTDIYLYNPHGADLTVNYYSTSGSGTLTVPANQTVSFYNETGAYPPAGSAVYFKGSDIFWGISGIDRGGQVYDWSYSLVPATLLTDEYNVGWAPGAYATPIPAANYDDSGLFITAVQDNTRVFIDTNRDGTAEFTYDLNRLTSQYVYDTADGDLSQANVWATGPIAVVYGQNPDTAVTGNPAIDTGGDLVPGIDFVDLVLSVEKTTNPILVGTGTGQTAKYTIVVSTDEYDVENLRVIDTLATGWALCSSGTTPACTDPVVTYPDGSTASVAPGVSGSTLTWGAAQFGSTVNMAPHQTLTIEYYVRTTAAHAEGLVTRSPVEAVGDRTVGDPSVTQTFTARDSVYNTYTASAIAIAKTSDVATAAYPGDTITYTVTVSNPNATTLTNVAVSDVLPPGVTYVAGSAQAHLSGATSANVRDQFGTAAYNRNDGSATWSGNWTETDPWGRLDNSGATGGLVWITGGQLQFRYLASNVADNFGTAGSYAGSDGTDTWNSDWTETSDNNSAVDGTILVTGGYTLFRQRGTAGRSISRTATVTGASSATINFTLTDNGIDAGETMVAEYQLDSNGWVVIGTLDGGSGWSGSALPLTVALSSNNTLTIRFRAPQRWSSITDDQAIIDNVSIDNSLPNAAGARIARTANLVGTPSATLSFSYTAANLEAGDTLVVEVSTNGTSFTALETLDGPAGSGTKSYNLVSPVDYTSAATTIRFRVTNGFSVAGESFSIDNVDITYTAWTTSAADDPPNFVTAGDAYSLLTGRILRVTFRATVDDPLGTDITTLTNTASTTCTQIRTPVSASVTDPVVHPDQGSGSVGDLVWLDTDRDGAYDVGEPGLPGVEVTLKDQYGATRMSTVTDSLGRYRFDNVAPALGYYVQVTGGLPSGLTQSAPAGRSDNRSNAFGLMPSGNYLDTFTTASYGNSDGTLDWRLEGWSETDLTGGGATGGEIRVTGGELRLNADTGGTANNIQRSFAIPAGSASATLSFDRRTTGVEAGDSIVLEIRNTGGSYTTLATFTGTVADGTSSYDISAYLSATQNATLRFRVAAGYAEADDFFYVDDVKIEYSGHPEYLDADLGYRPAAGTVTIGDLVWSDADGDQARDPGEPGLGGVTVQAYRDDGDGVFNPGLDTLAATAVTDAAGNYLFTGLSASGTEDYFVYVYDGQAPLTGYSPTVGAMIKVLDVDAGDVYLGVDFGYRNLTGAYTVTDRVWFDADGDGTQDPGEPGLGGVTVDLLDASLNVVGTAVTGSNGNFQFSGVRGGVRYSFRITDQANVLSGYYGTTAGALAGSWQMPGTLGGNTDYTSAPHFGYNQARSIGDTVYNDANNNQAQDAGESGFGGVTVRLYSDAGTLGVIDGTDAILATLVTDGNGNYLFTGLANGNYLVSIPTVPSGYTYTGTGANADSDPAAAGTQRAVTVSAGGSVLTADFGYRAATSRTVSGTLWNDTDADGVLDGGETGLGNVTVELWLDDGDNVFEPGTGDTLNTTRSTDASGAYSFENLAGGVYFVRPTDQNGVLSGYNTTYEETEGTAGSFNGYERADLSSGNQTGIDFGYRITPTPTVVLVSSFRAYAAGGRVVVEWETAAENGTVGFYLSRRDEGSGHFKRLGTGLLPGLLTAPQGGTYRFVDAGARPGRTLDYLLVEVESGGRERTYGPFTVRVEPSKVGMAPGALPADGYERQARPAAAVPEAGDLSAAPAPTALDPSKIGKVKITVVADGLHYLDAADLAPYLGLTTQKTVRLIQRNALRLSLGGRDVATLEAGGGAGLYFYGTAADSLFTRENVYILEPGYGLRMETVDGGSPAPAPAEQTFADTIRREVEQWPITSLFSDPAADYWFWDYLIAGNPSLGSRSYPLPSPGVADSGAAWLAVRLLGGTDTGHHVTVELNGVDVGSVNWTGRREYELRFPVKPSQVLPEGNVLTLTARLDAGQPYSIVYLNGFELGYPRLYQAVDDVLVVRGDGHERVSVSGFSGAGVEVLDLSDPLRPKRLTGITVDEPARGRFRVSFVPVSPQADYLALAGPSVLAPPALGAVPPAVLKGSGNAADYLVICPEAWRTSAQALADYRQGQGLEAMVVSVEQIMDEFAFSGYDPAAIRDFLAWARAKWSRPPRYVLLAGSGSFDYQNYQGYGGNWVPPLMAGTAHGLVPSDTAYADLDGDHRPDLAIGRLPVNSAAGLDACRAKIAAFEAGANSPWRQRALMLADNPDEAGDFPAGGDLLAAQLPAGFAVDKIYLSALPVGEARNRVLAGFDGGAFLVGYVGHGGVVQLAQEGLLTLDDVPGMSNVATPPIVTAVTCMAGHFAIPGFEALGAALVRHPDGGAAAVWAPSGMSENDLAVRLNTGFYRVLSEPAVTTLGDAVQRAMASFEGGPMATGLLDVFVLLGDPAMKLH